MGDKTEAPTPRKLEEARKEGQVARSIELNSAAILLIGPFLLKGPGKSLFSWMKNYLSSSIVNISGNDLTEASIHDLFLNIAAGVLPKLAIILVAVLITGLVVTMAQTKFLWSSKKWKFDFKRINPLDGLKRLFSAQGLIELLKAILKLTLIGLVAYSFLKKEVDTFIWLGNADLLSGIQKLTDLILSLSIRVGGTYLVLAVADYAYQRWHFMKQMRMTKEEVKEDFKRSEGDPFLRNRIRSQQRQLARNRMMANVPKASVVITNPTHYAVAIEYTAGKMSAPKVLAKGAFEVAQRIVNIARENNIPVVQNVPLARALFKTVDIDQQIPPDLYVAVAEILAYIYRLNGHANQPAHA